MALQTIHRILRVSRCGLIGALMLLGALAVARGDEAARSLADAAATIELRGAIGPATSDFFVHALKQATDRHARLFIVQMDTPGGLDTAMRQIIQAILASPIPVVTYVSPSGARAASAGTYIMYASHVAAMAPATNLGAATPIDAMSPNSTPAPAPEPEKIKGKQSGDANSPTSADRGSALEHKVVNDAIAYIRGLAELRGRNVEWAEQAVRNASSLSASDALKEHVVDVIATDMPDLLKQIDGRTVRMQTGDLTIHSAGLAVVNIESGWRTSLLSALTNPNVAYILMLIGIYGLLLEGYHPGAILPGVVGAISLLLALFAFQVLSVNFAGLAFILLGVVLIVAESFVPSFGALGIGGIVSFMVGSVMLMDSDVPGFRIATPLLAALGFVGGLITLGIVTFAMHSRRKPIVTGNDQLLREIAVVIDDFDNEGSVRIHGEIWNAHTNQPLRAGQRVKITSVDGLMLQVEPQ